MRTQWATLRESLVHAVSTPASQEQFEELRAGTVLRIFPGPFALIEHMRANEAGLDEKDSVLRELVRQRQSHVASSRLAGSLLWLALWPGLDGIRRRRRHHFPDEPASLVSSIAASFEANVERLRLDGIGRVAATLLRNTERDLMTQLKSEWARSANESPLPDDPDTWAAGPRSRGPSMLTGAPATDIEGELQAVHDELVSIVGIDAGLVLGALIYGEGQQELAQRLGLSHEAARKRYQRAVARVRTLLGPVA